MHNSGSKETQSRIKQFTSISWYCSKFFPHHVLPIILIVCDEICPCWLLENSTNIRWNRTLLKLFNFSRSDHKARISLRGKKLFNFRFCEVHIAVNLFSPLFCLCVQSCRESTWWSIHSDMLPCFTTQSYCSHF
jgi:hypothetical protein